MIGKRDLYLAFKSYFPIGQLRSQLLWGSHGPLICLRCVSKLETLLRIVNSFSVALHADVLITKNRMVSSGDATQLLEESSGEEGLVENSRQPCRV